MKRLFTYILAVALSVAGCEQNCEVDNIQDFELSHSEFEATCDGGTLAVKVTSKLNWTADADAGWITLRAADIESVDGRKADSGFAASVKKPFNFDTAGGFVDIEINIAANDFSEDRTGHIIFNTSDKRTFSLSIAQKGAPYNIDMDDMEGDEDFDNATKTLHFAAAGGQKSLGFTVSGDWTATAAEGQSWCSVTPASGQAGKQTITISAEAAESTEERTTTVTLACGTANITITIVQDGIDSIDMDDMTGDEDFDNATKTLHFTAKGGDKSLSFTASGDWTVTAASGQSWCSVSPASGKGGKGTITVTAKAAIDTAERTTKVTLTSGDATLVITVVQDGIDSIDMDDVEGDDYDKTTRTLHFAAEGGQKSLGFTVSGDWTATAATGQNWCSVTPASGQAGKCAIIISAEAAESTEERTTTVKIACGTADITITVKQDGDDGFPKDMELMFPDPNFREYVLSNFDTDKNGKISKEEAEAVTVIDVKNYNNYFGDKSKLIKSLEGIQYFTNLTYLNCDYNQLTTLDVSKNTQLEYLSCGYKNQLTTLNVSKNTQLTYLDCCYNRLTTLDVSGCMQLTLLYCYSNQLTTLDVSKNTKLTELRCYSNQLTTLDVSKTNLGNSTSPYPLDCSNMSTLKTLYLKKGWSIKYITDDNGRSTYYIPEQTEIIFID